MRPLFWFVFIINGIISESLFLVCVCVLGLQPHHQWVISRFTSSLLIVSITIFLQSVVMSSEMSIGRKHSVKYLIYYDLSKEETANSHIWAIVSSQMITVYYLLLSAHRTSSHLGVFTSLMASRWAVTTALIIFLQFFGIMVPPAAR